MSTKTVVRVLLYHGDAEWVDEVLSESKVQRGQEAFTPAGPLGYIAETDRYQVELAPRRKELE